MNPIEMIRKDCEFQRTTDPALLPLWDKAQDLAAQRAHRPVLIKESHPETGSPQFDALLRRHAPLIRYGTEAGNESRASYREKGKGADIITLPRVEAFKSRALYRYVLAHELGHWTGADTRCCRFVRWRATSALFRMEAAEEVTADLCAALVMHALSFPIFVTRKHQFPRVQRALNCGGNCEESRRQLFDAAAKEAHEAAAFLLS